MRLQRIAIFTNDDYTWSFPAWVHAINELKAKYDIVGILVFPSELKHLRGFKVILWYLKTFGLFNFIIFSFYSLKKSFKRLFSIVHTWEKLAHKHGFEFKTALNPNSEDVIQWVKSNQIDIVVMTVDQILKKEIISVPKIGIINKHAAILPSCKGLFPFFWAKLNNDPIGVTFHKVNAGIDSGPLLIQRRFGNFSGSMLRFYFEVFKEFPLMLTQAIQKLIDKEYLVISDEIAPSYFSLPTKSAVNNFKKISKVADLSDLFY